MGRDSVCARYVPDQGDRLQNAFRSGQCRVRGLRRILHRYSTASRRIIPALAALTPTRAHDRARNRFEPSTITSKSKSWNGWVTERSIVHAWKACVPKGTGGSNPPPSAIDPLMLSFALFDDLQLLSQFDHAAVRKNTAKIYAGIN